jgi:hypothetical protein
MKRFHTIAALVFTAGCASLPLEQQSTPQSDWSRTMTYAIQDANAGNYFAADRVLDEFARTHPDTREAQEIGFFRAMFLLDPANDRGSLASGISALDTYLADSTGQYRTEAMVLRRTAVVAQRVSTQPTAPADAVASATPATKDTVVVVSKSRDEEIASLKDQLAKSKDELAKVSAELDRIKKRLANPTP